MNKNARVIVWGAIAGVILLLVALVFVPAVYVALAVAVLALVFLVVASRIRQQRSEEYYEEEVWEEDGEEWGLVTEEDQDDLVDVDDRLAGLTLGDEEEDDGQLDAEDLAGSAEVVEPAGYVADEDEYIEEEVREGFTGEDVLEEFVAGQILQDEEVVEEFVAERVFDEGEVVEEFVAEQVFEDGEVVEEFVAEQVFESKELPGRQVAGEQVVEEFVAEQVYAEEEYVEEEYVEEELPAEPEPESHSIFATPGEIDEELVDSDDTILQAAGAVSQIEYDDVLTREDANAETREILGRVANLLAKYE
jgi:hypothetical protein